jgi:hypothetical protein
LICKYKYFGKRKKYLYREILTLLRHNEANSGSFSYNKITGTNVKVLTMPANTNIHSPEVVLTHHACKRAKERFSWNPSTLERMSNKATEGTALRKYFYQTIVIINLSRNETFT